MGLVPKHTKAEVKAFMGLSMKKIYGITGTMIFTGTIGNSLVHSKLTIPLNICAVSIFLWLNTSDPVYPKRPLYKGLLLWLKNKFAPKRYLSIIGGAFAESYKQERNKKNVKGEESKNNPDTTA